MNKIYIPNKSKIIPILENYLTYSENSICYHFNNHQYNILIPRKILHIYPLQIPHNFQFVIFVFSNGITLNRLQFYNNKLLNTTLFTFSTLIHSIEDISMKMIDGKVSFAILFNSSMILTFTIHPLDLFTFIPFSFTEFMINNNMIPEEIQKKMTIKLLSIKSTTSNENIFSLLSISRNIYITNENGIYKVNENGEIQLVVSISQLQTNKIYKVIIGKELVKKDNKEEMIIITENDCHFCVISQKEFTIKFSYNYREKIFDKTTKPNEKKDEKTIEMNNKILSISSYYQRSVTLLAISTKMKTLLLQISSISTSTKDTNELQITEYEGGITQLVSMYHLLENKLYLIIQNSNGNKRIEIDLQIEKEKSKVLPLLPLYDDEIKQQYLQIEEEMKIKRNELNKQQTEQMNQYVEDCQKMYGNALHTSMDLSLSSSITIDEYDEKDHDDLLLKVVDVSDEWLTQLGFYLKEYDEISTAITEMEEILQHINELKNKYDQNMKEYDLSYTLINDY